MEKSRRASGSLRSHDAEGKARVTRPRTGRQSSKEWLVGGGEMAKTIKGMNWSATPLGPMASWPQSLRTTVSLVQASNSPISLVWGPGHVQIYNDGYWPICGAKHPTAMGQDFRECWASAFPVIGEAYASGLVGQAVPTWKRCGCSSTATASWRRPGSRSRSVRLRMNPAAWVACSTRSPK